MAEPLRCSPSTSSPRRRSGSARLIKPGGTSLAPASEIGKEQFQHATEGDGAGVQRAVPAAARPVDDARQLANFKHFYDRSHVFTAVADETNPTYLEPLPGALGGSMTPSPTVLLA
jgi:hypothetical protein